MPSDATYHVGDVNAGAYTGDALDNSGYLRVTVSDSQVKVDYVRAYLPWTRAAVLRIARRHTPTLLSALLRSSIWHQVNI